MISGAKGVIRVLVVEDSPTTAMALKAILNADQQIIVLGIAKDGQEAIAMSTRLKPDLITMDVNLPLLDGLEVTKRIMASHPTPILILSNSAFTNQAPRVFEAISYGALDVANKEDFLSHDGHESAQKLIEKVKFLAGLKVIHHPLGGLSQRTGAQRIEARIGVDPDRLVAIVGSTGGPEAVGEILKQFPESFPCGIVIVIHLAHGFTDGFVQWLQSLCQIRVKTGRHGDSITPGVAYVAPTGSHMRVTKEKTLELGDEPPRSGLKPCGDYLLESVARYYKNGAVGVVLTGMGKDGASGIQQIKTLGGKTIAQNEKTSAIFGMPRVAIESGAVDQVLALDRIANEIMELLKR